MLDRRSRRDRLPVAAGTNAKERDAVSMLRVHVRLYLEYKARENGLRRVHDRVPQPNAVGYIPWFDSPGSTYIFFRPFVEGLAATA